MPPRKRVRPADETLSQGTDSQQSVAELDALALLAAAGSTDPGVAPTDALGPEDSEQDSLSSVEDDDDDEAHSDAVSEHDAEPDGADDGSGSDAGDSEPEPEGRPGEPSASEEDEEELATDGATPEDHDLESLGEREGSQPLGDEESDVEPRTSGAAMRRTPYRGRGRGWRRGGRGRGSRGLGPGGRPRSSGSEDENELALERLDRNAEELEVEEELAGLSDVPDRDMQMRQVKEEHRRRTGLLASLGGSAAQSDEEEEESADEESQARAEEGSQMDASDAASQAEDLETIEEAVGEAEAEPVIDQALEETRKAAQKDLTEIEITLAKLRERIFIEKSLVLDEEYQLITSEQHPMIQQRYKELEVQLKDQLAGLEGWIELRKDYIERKHSDMVMRAETDQAAKEKEYRAELTATKESAKWKLLAAKRQADDVLPPPELPQRSQLYKKRKAIKAESHELGRVQYVELGFPSATVLGAGQAETGDDLEAIGRELQELDQLIKQQKQESMEPKHEPSDGRVEIKVERAASADVPMEVAG